MVLEIRQWAIPLEEYQKCMLATVGLFGCLFCRFILYGLDSYLIIAVEISVDWSPRNPINCIFLWIGMVIKLFVCFHWVMALLPYYSLNFLWTDFTTWLLITKLQLIDKTIQILLIITSHRSLAILAIYPPVVQMDILKKRICISKFCCSPIS